MILWKILARNAYLVEIVACKWWMFLNSEESARKFLGAWNDKNVEELLSVLDPAVVNNSPLQPPRGVKGREYFESVFSALVRAFPDMKEEIITVVSKDDVVAIEYVESGTFRNQLELPPTGTFPPTSKSYRMPIAAFFEVNSKGLIREIRHYFDSASFLQQTGMKSSRA